MYRTNTKSLASVGRSLSLSPSAFVLARLPLEHPAPSDLSPDAASPHLPSCVPPAGESFHLADKGDGRERVKTTKSR